MMKILLFMIFFDLALVILMMKIDIIITSMIKKNLLSMIFMNLVLVILMMKIDIIITSMIIKNLSIHNS